MPALAEVLTEDVTWRVSYWDGRSLSEASPCPETGGAHVWACVDRAQVRSVGLVQPGGVEVGRVYLGRGEEPVFFRRRELLVRASGGQEKRHVATYLGVRGRLLYRLDPGSSALEQVEE